MTRAHASEVRVVWRPQARGRAAAVSLAFGLVAALAGCGETLPEPVPRTDTGAQVQPPPNANETAVVGPMTAPPSNAETPQLPPNEAANEAVPKPTDGTRKPAQTSDAKPMPGQNNDHSAPLATPK